MTLSDSVWIVVAAASGLNLGALGTWWLERRHWRSVAEQDPLLRMPERIGPRWYYLIPEAEYQGPRLTGPKAYRFGVKPAQATGPEQPEGSKHE